MRGMTGSAAAPAAKRRKFRRGSFILNPPSRFTSLDRRSGLPSHRPKRDGHHRRSPRSASTTQPKNLVGRLDMSERRITQLFGLVLGAIVTCTLVLNALAF